MAVAPPCRRRATRRSVVLAVTTLLLLTSAASVELSARAIRAAAAVRAASPLTWGAAAAIPGLSTLPGAPRGAVDSTDVVSLSCPSPGNCSAGGAYDTTSGPNPLTRQAFVVDESAGSWRRAVGITGLRALNVGNDATVESISCAEAGDCAAGGYFTDKDGVQRGFVVDESDGRWGTVQPEAAEVVTVSCGAVGDCAAGGSSSDGAFVVAESGGTWGSAQQVPGLAALANDGQAAVTAMSCSGAGTCAAGGSYSDPMAPLHPYAFSGFVVDETAGTWRVAQEVPGLGALNLGGLAGISSISCGAPHDCTAGGFYSSSSSNGDVQGFVADEVGGTWGSAGEIPGLGALNAGGNVEVSSVSCDAARDCAAGGYFSGLRGDEQGFVANETSGAWTRAHELAGLHRLNRGNAIVESVSCGAPGNCAAGGFYTGTAVFPEHSFVATESAGRWAGVQDLPGLTAWQVPRLDGGVTAVSCAAANRCAVAGEAQFASGPAAARSYVASEPGTASPCSPSRWLTGAGTTAAVASRGVAHGDATYRIVFTNRSPAGCTLAGIPGAIGYSSTKNVAVGPPAQRTRAAGAGGSVYLSPLGGKAETTYVIHLAVVVPTAACRPGRVDEVLVRAKGVPAMVVPLGEDQEVCQGIRSERIYPFARHVG